jgi:hypothetical protein
MHLSAMISFVAFFVPYIGLLPIFHVEAINESKRLAASAPNVYCSGTDLKVVYAYLLVKIGN